VGDFPRIVPRTIAGVAVAAALLALLFSTDVYTAWMFTLTLLIAAGAVMALRSRSVAAIMRQHWRPLTVILAVGAIAFGVAAVPFVLIYVPVRSIAPLRSYQEYLSFAASRAADLEWPGGLVSSGMGLHRRCQQLRCCPALDHSHRLTRASLHV
jgi:hypothetical protein